MTDLKIRKPYDASVRTPTSFPKETRTKQSFQAECDINNIMAKYAKTGVLEHTRNVQGAYGDFSDVPDFQEARNRLIAAEEAFMALPAAIRKRFDNDPEQFVAFLSDDANRDEAVKLGLVQKPEEPSGSDIEAKPKSPAEPTGEPASPSGDKKKSGEATKSE